MNETPLTDEQVLAWTTEDGSEIVHASFARELELKYIHTKNLLKRAQFGLDYNLLAAWGLEDLEDEINEALK